MIRERKPLLELGQQLRRLVFPLMTGVETLQEREKKRRELRRKLTERPPMTDTVPLPMPLQRLMRRHPPKEISKLRLTSPTLEMLLQASVESLHLTDEMVEKPQRHQPPSPDVPVRRQER